MRKIFSFVIFLLTILSFPISFAISCIVGEADIFDIYGIIYYMWISLLFIPIGILSLIIGFMLKKRNMSYRKNFIAAFICIPLLLLMGIYGIIARSYISVNMREVQITEEKINVSFPENMKVFTDYGVQCTITRTKILDESEKKDFEYYIMSNDKWTQSLKTTIKNSTPEMIQLDLQFYDFYLFYNTTLDEYNVYPTQKGEYNCILVAYNSERSHIIIVKDYTLLNE